MKILPTIIAFTVLAAPGALAQEERDITAEKWRCFAIFDFSKDTVVVELTRRTADGAARGSGEVSVAGFTHPALFRIVGFDRRWDFGEESSYAFVVRPDGRGLYYDFSSAVDGTATASQSFNCVSP